MNAAKPNTQLAGVATGPHHSFMGEVVNKPFFKPEDFTIKKPDLLLMEIGEAFLNAHSASDVANAKRDEALDEARELISALSTIMTKSASSVSYWEHEAFKWRKKWGEK